MSIKATFNLNKFKTQLNRVYPCGKPGTADPLPGLIEIKVSNKHLTLRTTDSETTFISRTEAADVPEFVAIVEKKRLKELLDRINTENIQFTISDNSLELKAGGTYKFEFPIEGDEPITFDPIKPINSKNDGVMVTKIPMTDLKDILQAGKEFIGSQFVDSVSNNFYFGDNVITTNDIVACFYGKKLLPEPTLIPASIMMLLNNIEDDMITILKEDDHIQFTGLHTFIDGRTKDDVDSFPAEAYMDFLGNRFDRSITFKVDDALSIFDRVNLFVDKDKDQGSAQFSFEADGVVIRDRKGLVEEVLKYEASDSFQSFACLIELKVLSDVIGFQKPDKVTLYFGDQNAIKVESSNITRVMSLVDDSDLQTDMDELYASPEGEQAAVDSARGPDVIEPTMDSEIEEGTDSDDVVW